MANFKDVLIEALNRDQITAFLNVNRGLMEIASATKKKPGFIKVAVADETAKGFMQNKYAGFILCIDGDMLNEIAKELDGPKATDATE